LEKEATTKSRLNLLFIGCKRKMEIDQKEALTILSSLGDEDGEITEEELKLEKRIREEFPVIDKGLKERERRNHFWEYEAEGDKRVIEAREKLNKIPSDEHYIALNKFMNLKRVVYHELLEKDASQ